MPAMRQCWLLAAIVLAGCGTDPDPRRATTEVIVLEILQPNCGQAQCHSQATQKAKEPGHSYAFDSIDRALESINTMGDAKLTGVLTGIDPDDERMPFDAPLNQQDIDLISVWLRNGKPDQTP